VESQQLASKVTQLEARVATLEDENKIVKGEVKQILTEIRSAILVRDNPFDADSAFGSKPTQVNVVRSSEPVAKVELHVEAEPAPEPAHAAPHATSKAAPQAPVAAQPGTQAREPLPLRPEYAAAPPAPEKPSWTLLTIASLSAWAEEAMGRVGALRLEILLDLCEAAGHITPEAREALSRVTELDIAEPLRTPSTNETAAILRQLETLVGDTDDEAGQKLQRSA
jgi:hypothetical protein